MFFNKWVYPYPPKYLNDCWVENTPFLLNITFQFILEQLKLFSFDTWNLSLRECSNFPRQMQSVLSRDLLFFISKSMFFAPYHSASHCSYSRPDSFFLESWVPVFPKLGNFLVHRRGWCFRVVFKIYFILPAIVCCHKHFSNYADLSYSVDLFNFSESEWFNLD